MKTKFKAILIVTLMLCSLSCEKESIKEDNTSSELNKPETLTNVNSKSNKSSNFISLEHKMQWISYVTAQILLENRSARQLFEDELANATETNVIPLANVLTNSTTYIDNTNFRDAFMSEFYLYASGCPEPNTSRPKPPVPTGGILPPDSTPTDQFDIFINSILNNECFEFYLPNGLAYPSTIVNLPNNGPTYTISTTHPLNDGFSNYGYRIESNCRSIDIIVNDNTIGIVVVVRPFEDYSTICDYSQYGVNDFTDFLE